MIAKTGSKLFFGLGLFGLVAAAVYGAASRNHEVDLETLVGVITLGYKGAVGDQFGYTVLVGVAFACLFIGCMLTAFRDVDPVAQAQVLDVDTVPEATAPATLSPWPVLAAFGVALVVLGLVTEPVFFVAGLIVVAIVVIEWTVNTWTDKATGDPAVNQAIRNRMMFPVEVPALALIGIAVFVFSVSRVLLVIPETGGYLVFSLVPVLILVVAWAVSARPRVSASLVTGLLLAGGVAVLVGGIVTASLSEREVEEHHEEEEEPAGEGEGSLGPDWIVANP